MQNLDQLRAAAALAAAESISRQAVSKLPAMILQNGLLAATAFATEDKAARAKMKAAIEATALHLSNNQLEITCLAQKRTASQMMSALSLATSLDLQRATTEALAFLKRFALKDETPT